MIIAAGRGCRKEWERRALTGGQGYAQAEEMIDPNPEISRQKKLAGAIGAGTRAGRNPVGFRLALGELTKEVFETLLKAEITESSARRGSRFDRERAETGRGQTCSVSAMVAVQRGVIGGIRSLEGSFCRRP